MSHYPFAELSHLSCKMPINLSVMYYILPSHLKFDMSLNLAL